jgi:hypothetical protein
MKTEKMKKVKTLPIRVKPKSGKRAKRKKSQIGPKFGNKC